MPNVDKCWNNYRDVNRRGNSQDQLAYFLHQFKHQQNDPVVVNIVFSKIKALGERAESFIDYVSSVDKSSK